MPDISPTPLGPRILWRLRVLAISFAFALQAILDPLATLIRRFATAIHSHLVHNHQKRLP
jgi:hypothetical protein